MQIKGSVFDSSEHKHSPPGKPVPSSKNSPMSCASTPYCRSHRRIDPGNGRRRVILFKVMGTASGFSSAGVVVVRRRSEANRGSRLRLPRSDPSLMKGAIFFQSDDHLKGQKLSSFSCSDTIAVMGGGDVHGCTVVGIWHKDGVCARSACVEDDALSRRARGLAWVVDEIRAGTNEQIA